MAKANPARQEAIRQGLKQYYGAPCKLGHNGLRWTRNKKCVECVRLKDRTRKRPPRRPRHPLYSRWRGMKRRCHDPENPDYIRYGSKGITICDRWRTCFVAFVADMGLPPSPMHTLDRIDGTLGYEPSNVRWATPKEQAHHRRDTKLTIEAVRVIRRLFKPGRGGNAAELAERFNVRPREVRRVAQGVRWKE